VPFALRRQMLVVSHKSAPKFRSAFIPSKTRGFGKHRLSETRLARNSHHVLKIFVLEVLEPLKVRQTSSDGIVQILVFRVAFRHDARTSMKLTAAFLSIVFTVGFGACTSSKIASKEVTLVPCCADGGPEKTVILQDSFEEGGRVVRLAPR
jgi:hypothetical protein